MKTFTINLIKNFVTKVTTPRFSRHASGLCLILTMLFTLGVGEMGAAAYIAGEFNGWNTTANEINSTGVSLPLMAGTTYEFKIVDNGTWYGKTNGAITSASTSVSSFSSSGGNCKITTTCAGDYTFKWSSNTVTVTYPSARTFQSGQKIYFKDTWQSSGNGSTWKTGSGNVYAYFSGDGTAWSTYGDLVSGSWNTDGAIYEITVPGSGKAFTTVYFTRGPSTSTTWNRTTNQTAAIGRNMFSVSNTAVNSQYTGSWGKYAKTPAVLGEFNNWDPDANVISSKVTIITLPASTTYRFTVLDGETYYANTQHATITNTMDWEEAYAGQNDYTMTTGEAGDYCFMYDNHWAALFYPQARLAKQKYIYLDTRPFGTGFWNTDNASYRFYFKHYNSGDDIGNVTSTYNSNRIDDDGGRVFPAQVPNSDDVGRIQLNRYNSAGTSQWGSDASAVIYASGRTSTAQNCMLPANSVKDGSWSGWTTGWTTYCPIKKTSTITDNGTVKTWGGSGTSGSPYYVAAGSNIKVSSASTDYIEDANMSTKYDFQVRNTSDVQQAHSDGVATTYEYTTPSTNNVTYKVRVNSYNYYNSTSSTEKWSSDIYYNARTPYNIAYKKGSNGTGTEHTDVKLNGIAITLRGAIFTRTGYTQTAWNTNSAGTGGTSYALSSSYTTNAAKTLYPTWTANTTTITLNANTSYHGSAAGSASVKYDATALTSISHATPAAGWFLEGYYTAANSGNKILNADGTLVRNTTYTTDEVTPKWKGTASSVTLYPHYIPIWRIAGSDMTDDDDAMGNWSTETNQITNITTSAGVMTSGSVTVNLDANTEYKFKVVNASDNHWWGNSGTITKIIYTNRTTNTPTLSDNTGNDQTFRSAAKGTYTFTWNVSSSTITITYPTSYKISIEHGYWNAANDIGARFDTGTGGTVTSAVASVSGSLAVTNTNTVTQYVGAGETVTFTHSTANSGWAWYGWGSTFNNSTHTVTAYTDGSGGVTINDGASTMTIASIGANKNVYSFFKENVSTITVNTANSNYGDLKIGGNAKSWGSTVTLGASTTTTIKGEGKNGYMFTSWALSGAATKASGNLTDQQITIKGNGTASSTGTATATFAPGYVIRGSLYDDSGNGGLAGWDNTTAILVPNLSTGVGTYTATLQRGKRYKFKVYFMEGSGYWRGTSETSDISSGTSYTLPDGGNDITFTAGANGTYTFTYNFSTKALTVTYPTAYSVTYYGNGSTSGSVPTDATPYASGETVYIQGNLGYLAKSNYTLSGWNTTEHITGTTYGSAGGESFTITGNTNLYAKWTHAISLDKNGGTGSSTVTATYNSSTLTDWSAPTRTGYTFAGYWTSETSNNGSGTLVINTSGVLQSNVSGYTDASGNWTSSSARTLYAKWTENSYSVTFYNGGHGTVAVAGATVANGGSATITQVNSKTLAATASTGYDFNGWTKTGGAVIASTSSASTSITATATGTVTANWTAHPYTISYTLNGGTVSPANPTSYTIESSAITLNNPTKDNYVFAGWTGTGLAEATMSVTIPAGSTGNRSYTATWNEAVASVTVSGVTTYYETVGEAFTAANSAAAAPTITMLQDVSGISEKLSYTKALNCTFDLNGHTVAGTVTQLLYVSCSGKTFTIQNTGGSENGKISLEPSAAANYSCVYVYNGTLQLEAGTIYLHYTIETSKTLYAVYVRSGRTFTMNGGKVHAETTIGTTYGIYTLGTTNINGGTIKVESGGKGYGVEAPYGTTNIYAPAAIDVTGTAAYGARVGGYTPTASNSYNGTLNIYGGTFDVTASTSTAIGVQVYSGKDGTDAYHDAGTANISGGTFTVEASASSQYAYGVYVGAATADPVATPAATITSACKFKVTAATSSRACAINTNAANTALLVQGGYYNINRNLSGYVAPTKTPWDYYCFSTTAADKASVGSDYNYKVTTGYVITYNAGANGTGTVAAGYKAQGDDFTLSSSTFTRTGYTQTGWSTSDGGSKTYNLGGTYSTDADITLYPFWGENSYDITFYNGGHGTVAVGGVTVANGGTAKVNHFTTKTLVATASTGYTFNGWTKGGTNASYVTIANTSAASTNIKSTKTNATVTANWTANTYSITLDKNGGDANGSATATYDATTLSSISAPTKIGYSVEGYYLEAGCTNKVATAAGALQASKTYTDASSKWISTSNQTLYTKWTANNYTVNYSAPSNGNYTIKVASGTASSASKTANYQQTITLAATPSTGYHFVSWTVTKAGGGTVTVTSNQFSMPADDVTVTATFAINTYAISYAAGTYGSGSLAGGSKTHGVAYTLSSSNSAFTRTGYTYDGWSTNAAGSSKDYNLGGSYTTNAPQTFYPHWVVTNYTISYDLAGGSVATPNPTSYTIESSAITLNNPTRTGYTFAGWTGTGLASATMSVTIPAGSTGNRTYTATWTVNSYTITFNSNGGSAVASITQNYGTAVVAPANPTKTGYTFAGWDPAVPSTMPATNTTCVAQWTAAVASVAISGGSTTYYSTVTGAFTAANAATAAVTITMLSNASVTSALTYNNSNTQNCTLDLNGYTITSTTSSRFPLQINMADVTFTITDNSVGKAGKLSMTSSQSDATIFGAWANSGTLVLEEGTIEALSSTQIIAGATAGANGTFTMNGGTIHVQTTNGKNAYGTYFNGVVTINGGTIHVEAAGTAYGINYAGSAETEERAATVNGGKFNITGSTAYVTDDSEYITIQGGWYNTNNNLASRVSAPYHVFNLDDATYNYEVALGYTLTWTTDGDALTGTYTSGTTKVGTTIVAPNTPTKTGYTFNAWSPTPAATMPAANTEYTATWTANTNTAYTVKHWQQNLANDDYTEVTGDRQSLTGTTATSTAAVAKTYTGFTAQSFTQGTIAPDGSTVVNIYYNRNKYTITWKSEDGTSTLETDSNVKYGATTAFNSSTPTKAATAQYTYTFDGWATSASGAKAYDNGSTPTASASVTYYAHFSSTVNNYTVTIVKNEDGWGSVSTTSITSVPYGTSVSASSNTLTVTGKTPVTATPTSNTAQYTYAFGSWSGVPATITGNVTITANFTRTVNNYTVTVARNNTGYGTVSAASVASVPYGSAITVSSNTFTVNGTTVTATPTAATAQYTYAFSGWTNAPGTVEGNMTVTANFTRTTNTYTILWKSEDGTSTLETDASQAYGTATAFNGSTPTKDADEDYTYTFDGWATSAGGDKAYNDGSTPSVTGNATYYAHFSTTNTVAQVVINSGSPSYHTTLADAFSTAGTGTPKNKTAEITVLRNIEDITEQITYSPTNVCTTILDLNGHTVQGAITSSNYQLIRFNKSSAVLEITDGSTGGKLHNEASVNTSLYCVYVYAGHLKITGGTVSAKNTLAYDASTAKSVYTYAAISRESSSAKMTISGGTVKAEGDYRVYAVCPQREDVISGGTIIAEGRSYVGAVLSNGTNVQISGGEFTATATTSTYAYGIRAQRGQVEVTGSPTFNVTAKQYAYGVFAGDAPTTSAALNSGHAIIRGGTFTVSTTTPTTSGYTDAYGVYGNAGGRKVTTSGKEGNYASAGTIDVYAGATFDVTAYNTVYGIASKGTVTQAKATIGGVEYPAASASPELNIYGGKFMVTKKYASGTAVGAVCTTSAAITNEDIDIRGGYYNINDNLASYTAPTKSCNYHVFNPTDLPAYPYKVAEGYTLTWDLAGGTVSTAGTGAAVDATGTPNIVVEKDASISAPIVTKIGYTFSAWSPAPVASTMPAANTTYTATWTTVALTFTGDVNSNWNNLGNWSPACIPTIEHDVLINKPCFVDITNAQAKSVVLNQSSGKTGQLILEAGKELVVATTVKKTTDGSNRLATGENDLVFNSTSGAGLGALVMGTHDGTNNATVNFATLSNGEEDNTASDAQYVGTPFGNHPKMLYQFYNSWMYKFINTGVPGWTRVDGEDGLDAFQGYCIFSADGTNHVYWMQGTLVASEDQSINLQYNGGTASNPDNENMLANSWMAPIKIAAFQASDFTNADATIYIYNTGSPDDYKNNSGASTTGTSAGQYTTYTPGTAGSAIIPSMQAFSVYTHGSTPSISLDYSKIVYDPAVAGSVVPGRNRAPQRTETDEPEKMRLYIGAESGYGDMLYMLEREDFAEGFENGWDGRKMFGEDVAPQLYAFTPDGNMAINCIPTFEGQLLGFRKGAQDNTYTFTFEYDGDNMWYLNDLKEQTSTLISAFDSYTFTSEADDTEARFIISRSPIHSTPTAVESATGAQQPAIRKIVINDHVFIIRNGLMYDVTGIMVR